MTNLESLYLYGNQISDISALKNLTKLTHLEIDSNQIIDISALKGLTNLTYLSIGNNQISDISALKDMTNLEELYLCENKISDMNISIDNLKKADIGNQKIEITSDKREVELPVIVKQAFEKFGATNLECSNCTVNDAHSTANITKTSEKSATITIKGGKLEGTTITIAYTGAVDESEKEDKSKSNKIIPQTGEKIGFVVLAVAIIVMCILYKKSRKNNWK